MSHHWYVARLKPGATREAKHRYGIDQSRVGETIAERSVRDIGFDCYLPRMRRELRHHRTNEKITRSFPLFPGYMFVAVPGNLFGLLHGLEGVGPILGIDGRPAMVPERLIADFRTAEQNLEFDETEEARIKRREQGRTKKETVELTFPSGSIVRVKSDWRRERHPFRGMEALVASITPRGRVEALLNLFGGLVPVELDAMDLEAA